MPEGGRRPAAEVTVVIAAWDDYVGPRLQEAVDSALAQTVPVAVVLVDNASSPKIPARAGVAAVRSPTRLSEGDALNLGLAQVEGPFVLFLDADDLLLPTAAEAMLDRVAAAPEAIAWVTGVVDGAGRAHRLPRRLTRPLVRFGGPFCLAHATWSLVPAHGMLVTTEALRAIGGYPDTSDAEDWQMTAVLACTGRISVCFTPTYVYRCRAGDPDASVISRVAAARRGSSVRRRLRRHPMVPRSIKTSMPLVWLVQTAILSGLRPAVHRLRHVITEGAAIARADERLSAAAPRPRQPSA